MRLIDANELLDRAICTRNYFEIKSLVERMPTIAPPPNAPLTLEELREMDGEPVWIAGVSSVNNFKGHWDICDWENGEVVSFPYCAETPCINDYGITWLAYRRRPEEVKEREAAYIEIMARTYGPFRQKISQWLQAEKDGRLVVLPCQIGAPVWWITLSWVEKTVTVRYTIESGQFRYAMLDWQNPVYTSQAAAEAALAETAKEGTTSEKSHSD